MGVAVSWVPSRLRQQFQTLPGVEEVAAFRLEGGGTLAVSRNLLPMVGATAIEGRLFTSADPWDVMLLVSRDALLDANSHPVAEWRGRSYRVVGHLDPSTRLLTAGTRRIVPLADLTPTSGTLLLLEPGAARDTVEEALRKLTGDAAYRLSPYQSPVHWYDPLLPGLGLACVAWVLCAVVLRVGGAAAVDGASWYYWAALGARLTLLLTGITLGAHLVERWANRWALPVTILHFWFLLVVCFAACYWVLQDHRNRCPQCLEALAFPTRVGTYGSLMLDAAATEYACPRGHGLLAVPDTQHAHSRWTALDASWRDLFDRKGPRDRLKIT
jgi:hypothetical protein